MSIFESSSPTRKASLFLGCIAVAGLLVGNPFTIIVSVVCGAGIVTLAD
ncbi:MAG: hypothetical protein WAK91_01110 [Candidatus Acidiferrales bacterium]|jgi:hypothetical protein